LVQVYEDISTGSNMDRPGFVEMSDRLETNGFDGVIVLKLDRLSRSLLDSKLFINGLTEKSKFLVSVTESFDTCTVQGRLFLNMILCFCEAERETITQRMVEGREELARNQKFPSSFLYGYQRDIEGDLVKVSDEAKTVELIYALYTEHESVGKVQKLLNDKEIRTRRGKSWTRQQLLNLLSHPAYAGKGFRWKNQIIKGSVERIVSTQRWNTAQKIIESKSRKKTG
jgi:site-specific DNA recombinase